MKRIVLGIVGLLAVSGLAGCHSPGDISLETNVNADGSWNRHLEYGYTSLQYFDKRGHVTKSESSIDHLAFPITRDWSMSKTYNKRSKMAKVTATRSMHLGEVVKSTLVVSWGNPLLDSVSSVKQIGPHRFEYRETLHWFGPRITATSYAFDIAYNAAIRSAFSPQVATKADTGALRKPVLREFWHYVYGPPDVRFMEFFVHRKSSERQMILRIGPALEKVFGDQFGNRINKDQRRTAARTFIKAFLAELIADRTDARATELSNKPANDAAEYIPLMLTVKLPGKIVSTNGDMDPSSDEIYWATFAVAASFEDITLTAVCDVSK